MIFLPAISPPLEKKNKRKTKEIFFWGGEVGCRINFQKTRLFGRKEKNMRVPGVEERSLAKSGGPERSIDKVRAILIFSIWVPEAWYMPS